VLASLKGLRGTAFDVFGRTEERRAERALIGEYQAMVRALLPELDAQRLDHAIEVASVPESIRGYGHVKARHLQAARQRWSELLVAGKPRQAHSDRGPTRAPRREATQ
jgi:indolepyruvate ferredoxin oxidoreductase